MKTAVVDAQVVGQAAVIHVAENVILHVKIVVNTDVTLHVMVPVEGNAKAVVMIVLLVVLKVVVQDAIMDAVESVVKVVHLGALVHVIQNV